MSKSTKIIFGASTAAIIICLSYGILTASPENGSSPENTGIQNFIEIQNPFTRADISFDGTDIKARGNIEISGNAATIKQPGEYVISGQSNNGMIIVDYEGKDETTLILNGLHLESKTGPAIYIKKSGDATIFLAEHTTNFIADAKQYNPEFKEEITGAIYSKSDLNIQGKGNLTVHGNHNDAIVSKDDLDITNATLKVHSIDDGIRGKDSIEIENANIKITAKDDGLKSDNKKDKEKAYIRISETTIKISAGDDAITALNRVDIESGNITILSLHEGIEAREINIYGGYLEVRSIDNSLNAVKTKWKQVDAHTLSLKTYGEEGVSVNIYGGEVVLFSELDAIDSNGNFLMAGGVLIIVNGSSPSAEIIDANRQYTVKGGKLVAVWASGYGRNPSQTSTQYSMRVNIPDIQSSGTVIRIVDEDIKEELLHFTSEKEFRSIAFSSPDLQANGNYTLYLDDTAYTTVTLVNSFTEIGTRRVYKGD